MWKWLLRLFGLRPGPNQHQTRPKSWPTREEIALLPFFDELGRGQITAVETEEAAVKAYEVLSKETVLGFDTESKPTFVKGEVSTGPHVAQFSTVSHAYIFSLHADYNRKVVNALIESPAIKKVGFGLGDDLKRIRIKLGIEPVSVLDLETMFRAKGYGRGVGVKTAVALIFKRRFRKSRKVSTSNWKNPKLSLPQLLYAANDAYAPIRVYNALTKTSS